MSSNNILEPIPSNFVDYLLKYPVVTLSDTVPAALEGTTNITWQLDGFGNVSACAAASEGVTTVSVVTANGVSGTVANPSTTPEITLQLGDITPTSVTINTSEVPALNIISSNGTGAQLDLNAVNGGGHGWFIISVGESGDGPIAPNSLGFFDQSSSLLALELSDIGAQIAGILALPTSTVATSATAGAASALPVTPLGYLEIIVNGTTVKLPYYSV